MTRATTSTNKHAGRDQADESRCPRSAYHVPVLKLKESIDTINEGERVEIGDRRRFARCQAWCNTTGNTLISSVEDKGNYTVIVEKGSPKSGKTVTSYGSKGRHL